MQFQVPQFLDVEDKIIGPLTIKQFIFLAGGVGLGYLAWKAIPIIGLLVGFACIGAGAALAFYKFNGKPFVYIIEAGMKYVLSNRHYVWRRKKKKMNVEISLENYRPVKHTSGIPMATQSKLSDLTWSIDVKTDDSVEAQRVRGDNLP
jgi:hypothetical protein